MAKKKVSQAAAAARKPEGQVGELTGPVDPRACAAIAAREKAAAEAEAETDD